MKLTHWIPLIADQLGQQKGIIAVLIYGSYAKGTANENSDIDIAILYEHQFVPSPPELWDLKTQLDRILATEVDLLCLNLADPIIGNQIYQSYKPVLVNDPVKLAEYFALLCGKYMELKEFIRPMEEQILQRKYRG